MTGKKYDQGKLPMWIVIGEQFPDAIKAVAECSNYGHYKYELDGDWMNFKRVHPIDRYLDALIRHLMASGKDIKKLDDSGLPHLYHAARNLMAFLQLKIESNEQTNSPTDCKSMGDCTKTTPGERQAK